MNLVLAAPNSTAPTVTFVELVDDEFPQAHTYSVTANGSVAYSTDYPRCPTTFFYGCEAGDFIESPTATTALHQLKHRLHLARQRVNELEGVIAALEANPQGYRAIFEADETPRTYMLTCHWTIPEEGNEGTACSCRLTEAEADQVEDAIAWLQERAGDEWGGALPAWELVPEPDLAAVDRAGLDAVLGELRLRSRYAEFPGHYGPERYPPFEAR